MGHTVRDYFRFPDSHTKFASLPGDCLRPGFFRFGDDIICYGRATRGYCTNRADGHLYDTAHDTCIANSHVSLAFDPDEIVENLLCERYTELSHAQSSFSHRIVRRLYYMLRPYLRLPLRSQIQRFHFRNWDKLPFPEWPVDVTVDRLQQRLLGLSVRAAGLEQLPFIWFWPDGFTRACSHYA